jgi:DNA-binding HxlR family transcriptional regulator
MRRKSFGNMQCPIARSLERVGEWWSILILRDAFHGLSRFDEFQENLGIAPNMLARRLKSLVVAGLLERRRYSERPPRDEYLLTQAGRDFRPVLWALLAWGNKHFAPEGPVSSSPTAGPGSRPMLCWSTARAVALSSRRISVWPLDRPPTHAPGVAMALSLRSERRPKRAPPFNSGIRWRP